MKEEENLKIYHISQKENNGYDTYSDAVVIAENEEEARRIHPSATEPFFFKNICYDEKKKAFKICFKNSKEECFFETEYSGSWTNNLSAITVKEVGKANPDMRKGVLCASFHAG